ncbi:MAG: HAMP domain-containing histidine kinase [Solirubrobacterales bacterium]|nr:HAMP domain-containing histidine kinase [Solirubrobacterales bacterium]
MSRLPIRLRLTAVFVVVMGAVLLVIGSFLYFSTEHDLDDSINAALRSRQSALKSFAATVSSGSHVVIPSGERFAQLLGGDGSVLESRPSTSRAVLSPAETARAMRAVIRVERYEHFRFVAGPADLGGRRVVVVAGASLADRERALEGLGGALLVGLPLALLLAAGIAYATAAGALAPVEAIRKRAETIIRADPSSRVPMPETEDEVRRLARTLNDMLQRLARASAHERSFVANASHELRTPLAALRVEIELALRHATSTDELRAALERCQGDTHRLIALANDLLVLARADDGPQAVRKVTDVDDLLADVIARARHEAWVQQRAISLRPSGLSVAVDPVAVSRAISNLVDNALVHGRGQVTLGADPDRRGDGVVIWVRDEGEFEDPEIVDQAFDRFYRGRKASGRPGAGLGLALVKEIAAAHDGAAHLESTSDGETRASIELPTRRE